MHCQFIAVICFCLCATVFGYLDGILKNYDLVQPSGAKRRIVKRGANNPNAGLYNRIEELQFFALNREFRLILTPKRGLFSSRFESVVVTDGRRIVDYLDVEPNDFMEGHVYGELESTVSANVDENGAINALIQLVDDAFTVEPAWRFLQNMPLNVSIIYRHSELVLPKEKNRAKKPICEATPTGAFEHSSGASNYWWFNGSIEESSNKVKRQAEPSTLSPPRNREKNRCSVKLVADYRFFEYIGRKKASLTSRYLINLIDRVNTIYTSTVWRDNEQQPGISNMGFVIKKILIHSAPTNERDHYNSNRTDWADVNKLLQRFSEEEGNKDYCVVHLFTYQSFTNGVLGLGYIASAREGTSGGICGVPIADGKGRFIYYNTALSSAKSSSGGPVVTREADIVTAHEFGHNWGSPHDLDSSECSPPSKSGGSFIMYTYSVSGYDDNNKRFSPCSRRNVKAVLEAKAHLCFQEEEVSFCGNQRVEPGEECDEGLLGDPDGGRCCTSECKFKPNARCSPKNSLCCTTECQFERAGHSCREGEKNRCLEEAKCDGKSRDCPPSKRHINGTSCLDMGECQNGICVSFCERQEIGMKPCICENMTQTCFRCCRRTNESECVPFLKSATFIGPLVVSNGTRCINGYCSGGKCVQEAADFVQHLWRIIDKLDINGFWKFLYDNIVGTIILATLIVWIPIGCIVHRWDERTRRECQNNLDFIVSNILVSAGDSDRVTVIEGVKSITGRNRNSPPAAAV